jgi:hypothetical protein
MVPRPMIGLVLAFGLQSACDQNAGDTSEATLQLVAEWPRLPPETSLGQTVGVGVDSHNHVFVFHRSGSRVDRALSERPHQHRYRLDARR